MNRHSSDKQLDNKGWQQGLPTPVQESDTQRLAIHNERLPTFSQDRDTHHENQGLATAKQGVANLPTTHNPGVGNNSPPLKGGNVANPSDASPTFDELIELRKRLDDGAAWCQRRLGDRAKQQRGIDRYVRLLCGEYLPGIRALRSRDHDYASELATVEERLTRGAEVDGHDDLFAELLTTYEVLYDITDDETLERHIDRMEYLRSA